MRKMIKMSMAAVMVMGVSSVSVQANDILTNIKADGQVRARYEMVDAKDTGANPKGNANAFTNRLSLGVGADLMGTSWLSAYVQMTDVRSLNGNYNDASGDNGTEWHDVVADAEQTRLTQAYIDAKYGKTKLRMGRQAINLDNIRFVGTVDWRQMPQTFDAVTLTDNTIEGLNLFASYVTQVNRVFADDVQDPTGATAGIISNTDSADTRTLLLNASYKVMPELTVTVYDYMIGSGTLASLTQLVANPNANAMGSDTYGISAVGSVKVTNDASIRYRAEYAKQGDPTMENSGFTNSGVEVDADYMNFELGANVSGFMACMQYEVLSGTANTTTNPNADDKTTFQTPLATLHAHNGWADMFLVTPAAGLEDLSASVGYKSKEFGLFKVTYHDYTSDVRSIDYGTEINAIYTRAVPNMNNLTGTLKVADYSAGDTVLEGNYAAQAMDTTKFWAMLDYKFATK